MILPANHYWIIGGSSTDVYSSATNTMVPVADATYVAWAANNIASPIASIAELAVVIQSYNVLPAWLFNASDTFIQPTTTTYTKGQLAAYSADARFRHASGGLTITSLSAVPFLTDATSRNTINSGFQYAQANPAHITNWKTSSGTFIPLSNTQMATLNNDVTVFVQACFTEESTLLTSINGGTVTTLAAIDAAYAAVANTVRKMAVVNITVTNDADFYRTFQYLMASGPPINMSGATLEMMLRRHAEDAEAVMRLATDTGEIVLTDPINGLFTVFISQIELERLDLGSYDHSNIMTQGGLKTKIWSGTLINNAGPTR